MHPEPALNPKRSYFENLDATRFLGFFHVFLAHCFFTTNAKLAASKGFAFFTVSIKAGFLGLDYFFVLSAFLLTWLALEEWKVEGRFRPGLFMIRRGIRLWPLYFILLALIYGFAALLGDRLGLRDLPPIAWYLGFVSNYYIIEHGQQFLFVLVFFWSISVEEQFYAFWALVLRFLKRHLVAVCLGMMAVSIGFRAWMLDREPVLAFHTLSVLGNFGTGALAAVLAFRASKFRNLFVHMKRSYSLLVYLLLLLLLIYYFDWFDTGWPVVIEKQVFALFFAWFILEQSFAQRPLIRMGSFPQLSYLGQLSLGLYCYHGLVLTLLVPLMKRWGMAETPFQVYVLNPVLIFLLTLLLAVGSYEWFEKKVHRWRRYFYPRTKA
jgi:peptidoglycan/LPS O-acetylase OafA/YrhL